jgi:thioredoxin 1
MNKGILFFNAPWCEPCGVLKPVIEQLGRDGINVKSINTEYDAMNTERYQIKSIPTLILTDLNGNEIKRTQAGGWTKEQVLNWFNS